MHIYKSIMENLDIQSLFYPQTPPPGGRGRPCSTPLPFYSCTYLSGGEDSPVSPSWYLVPHQYDHRTGFSWYLHLHPCGDWWGWGGTQHERRRWGTLFQSCLLAWWYRMGESGSSPEPGPSSAHSEVWHHLSPPWRDSTVCCEVRELNWKPEGLRFHPPTYH